MFVLPRMLYDDRPANVPPASPLGLRVSSRAVQRAAYSGSQCAQLKVPTRLSSGYGFLCLGQFV
jgi:hypothetical protein